MHLALLCFTDTWCFYKLKVCSNPVLGKSSGAIFPMALFFRLRYVHFLKTMLCTLNGVQYSVNINFICIRIHMHKIHVDSLYWNNHFIVLWNQILNISEVSLYPSRMIFAIVFWYMRGLHIFLDGLVFLKEMGLEFYEMIFWQQLRWSWFFSTWSSTILAFQGW